MTSMSNSSQSTRPTGRVLWEELLLLSRFHSFLREVEWKFLSPVSQPAVLDSIGSICIKAVASKMMHSVFSIMLRCLQIRFWANEWNLVIDSSHSFWKYFKTHCAFSKDKIPPWKSKLLTNTDASPNHSWLHCCIFGMSASVLLLAFCLGS